MKPATTFPTLERRHGFTLVEVLIVIFIIAILASLGLGLLGTVGTQARVEQTRVLIKRLDDLVRAKLKNVDTDRKFYPQFISKIGIYDPALMPMPGLIGGKAVEIIAKKSLQRRMLPGRTLDLTGWDDSGMMDTWDDSPVLTGGGISEILTESDHAAALFAALCPDGQVPDGLPSSLVATSTSPESTGKLMFVDGWGNPIRFYQWPTRLIYGGDPSSMMDPNTTVASALIASLPARTDKIYNSDSADPNGLIKNKNYIKTGAMAPGTPIDPTSLHDLGAYSVFLLVSAGPDGTLGLAEPYDTAGFGHLGTITDGGRATDNITNRQVR